MPSAASVERRWEERQFETERDKAASLEAQMQAMEKRNRQLQTELSKSMKPGANGFSFLMVLIVLISFLVGYMNK